MNSMIFLLLWLYYLQYFVFHRELPLLAWMNSITQQQLGQDHARLCFIVYVLIAGTFRLHKRPEFPSGSSRPRVLFYVSLTMDQK